VIQTQRSHNSESREECAAENSKFACVVASGLGHRSRKIVKLVLNTGYGNADSVQCTEDGALLRDFEISGLILT
jgi:hypothetical protein